MTEIEENIWKIKRFLFEDQKDINLFYVEMFLKMIQNYILFLIQKSQITKTIKRNKKKSVERFPLKLPNTPIDE